MSKFYVDTHCHLDLMQGIPEKVTFEDSLPIKTISVTNAPSFFHPNEMLFKGAKNIRVALGLHPELCSQFSNQLPEFFKYLESVKYIGEIGLDGSLRFKSSFQEQYHSFENILKGIADSSDKILTLHTRNAEDYVIELLKKYKIAEKHKVIFHWYSGDKKSLNDAIRMGIFFSVNHKMLQSKNGIEIVKNLPLNLLLTETDAPFTFDSTIKTRLDSLELSSNLLSRNLLKEKDEVVEIIWSNFKALLQ